MSVVRVFITTLALLLLSHFAEAALYGGNSLVSNLNQKDFDTNVAKAKDMWIVHFYDEADKESNSLAPKFAKAAIALEGIVKFGAVNVSTEEKLASEYAASSKNPLKVFTDRKNKQQSFNGAKTANGIVNYFHKEIKRVTDERINPNKASTSKSTESNNSSSNSGTTTGTVVELTEKDFKNVYNSDTFYLVAFTAPWCGYCQKLKPEFTKAARQLHEKGIQAVLANVDCTVHQNLCQQHKVQGYPTLKVFKPNTPPGSGADYQGAREAAGIVTYVTNYAPKAPPKMNELLSQAEFDACSKNNMCVVAVLPDIRDSNAKEMKSYIQALKDGLADSKNPHATLVWTNAKKHRNLEKTLQVGENGYPVIAAFSTKRKIVAPMNHALTRQNVSDFISGLVTLRGSDTRPLDVSFDKVETVKAWDGKDANPHDEL